MHQCWIILILALDMYSLNYSNAYGLQKDTNMSGNDYAWVSSALYFGWLVGAYPWQFLLQRHPIGKLIGYMLFIWGGVCMLQVRSSHTMGSRLNPQC
jgi:hypothetical protein